MESRSSPLILFTKNIEKSVVGNPAAYTALGVKLESLPKNVVVIASHTQTDSHKEKVGHASVVSLFLNVYIFMVELRL